MPRNVGADEDVVGIGRVDPDRTDRSILGDGASATAESAGSRRGHAPGDERPVFAAVRRFEEADACLGVTRAIRFAGSDIESVSSGVIRIEGDRTDRSRLNAGGRRMPVWM